MVVIFAAVMPVESGDAFERPASQPKRVQSCVPARCCTGSVAATALSAFSRVDAAPQAQTARKDKTRKLIVAAKEGCAEYDAGGAAPAEIPLTPALPSTSSARLRPPPPSLPPAPTAPP